MCLCLLVLFHHVLLVSLSRCDFATQNILPSVLLCASVYVRAYMRVCNACVVCVCVWAAGDRDQHRPFLPAPCLTVSVCVGGCSACVPACMQMCKHVWVCACASAQCMHVWFFLLFLLCAFVLNCTACLCVFFLSFSLCAFVINCTSCLLLIFWGFLPHLTIVKLVNQSYPLDPHASPPTT